MANFHALMSNNEILTYALHIAVPNVNNSAAINYRTAIVNSGLGGKTVLADGDGVVAGTISAAEKTSILNGSLYEYVGSVAINNIVGSKAVFLAALITEVTARELAVAQARLQWYGFTQ